MTDLLDKLANDESYYYLGPSATLFKYLIKHRNFDRQYVAELLIYFRFYRDKEMERILLKAPTLERLRKYALRILECPNRFSNY